MTRRLFLLVAILALSSSLLAQSVDSLRVWHYSSQHARESLDWVREGVIYEIYPRAFSPAGNFAGIEERLPELKKLGVTILWIMPIHPVGELHRKGTLGSPYSVRDYYGINPEFGTLADFKRLVARAHELGFHLLIDLVANHTSWDSKLITEHPEWFTKDSAGNIIPPNPDWTDVASLDYSHQGLRRYMIEMMKYWVRDIGIDGYRCDVAERVPLDFWEAARTALDSIKPVMMLAEGARPDHHLKAFDLSYSWDLYSLLGPLINGKRKPADMDTLLKREALAFPAGALRMRFSSNHDENAWDAPDVVKLGNDGAKLAAAFVNTLPGVPLLYNGQEAANAKPLRLFEKDTIDWSRGDDFRKLYTTLFALRRSHPALTGSMVRIRTTSDDRVFAYARISGPDRVLVALNFSKEPFSGSLKIPSAQIVAPGHVSVRDLITGASETVEVFPSGFFPVSLPPQGFKILSVGSAPH
ncbi:MAG TPA: alpha-amylase family glycosyl hydrolase [Bacteroidota bacterium]|nr:alpha-amylase family glycosyl hydrolase [Bacteroidota bacterium]